MPHYLIQAGYTSEGWKALLKKPENRSEAVRPVIEKLGGKIVQSWYAFGEHDVVAIVEMPDNVSAAAFFGGAGGGWRFAVNQNHALAGIGRRYRSDEAGSRGWLPPSRQIELAGGRSQSRWIGISQAQESGGSPQTTLSPA